jgi:hypothetical protein
VQFGSGGDIRAIYEQILALQATRLPFTVYTGKRQYQNMLVASLRTHTDQKLEFSFLADIEFREVILVNTQAVNFGTTYNSGGLSQPQANAPTVPLGQQQAAPATVPDAAVPAQSGGTGDF